MNEVTLCVISAGEHSGDHYRVRSLMQALGYTPEFMFVARHKKLQQLLALYRKMRATSGIVYVEGTGTVSGVAAVAASLTTRRRVRYLISSGDAVDAYLRNRFGNVVGIVAGLYERLLYRASFAFIGWTPYLVGRAIRMGASRGVTLEGFVPELSGDEAGPDREQLGIANDALVVAVTGTINWSKRQSYAYGLDLVNAARHVTREDVCFLVIGGGSGLDRLRLGAAGDPRFIFVGRVERERMPGYLSLIDAAVIAQTPDELGQLRLTTKLPEYLAAGVHVVMPAMPGAIDYLYASGESPISLVKSGHPASDAFARSLGAWIQSADKDQLHRSSGLGQSVARARFSLEVVAPRLRGLLDAETS